MSEVAFWRGEFGDAYTERNARTDFESRIELWINILECFSYRAEANLFPVPTSVLEIGAGDGANLKAIYELVRVGVPIAGIEPNASARALLKEADIDAFDGTAEKPGRMADLVFSSGVLIHIPPDELMAACQGIYDAAERYIVSIEYFAAEPEEKVYRGMKLWKRDFGSYWLDNFNIKPLGCGFAWKRMTDLDNLTWVALQKC